MDIDIETTEKTVEVYDQELNQIGWATPKDATGRRALKLNEGVEHVVNSIFGDDTDLNVTPLEQQVADEEESE